MHIFLSIFASGSEWRMHQMYSLPPVTGIVEIGFICALSPRYWCQFIMMLLPGETRDDCWRMAEIVIKIIKRSARYFIANGALSRSFCDKHFWIKVVAQPFLFSIPASFVVSIFAFWNHLQYAHTQQTYHSNANSVKLEIITINIVTISLCECFLSFLQTFDRIKLMNEKMNASIWIGRTMKSGLRAV